MSKFYIADKVLRRNEKAGKLHSLLVGPYANDEIDESNVVIERSKNKRIKVHVNRLKRYRSR